MNTPAFLLAVLKHEKLIQPMKGKKPSHELVDPGPFLAKVDKLISSNTARKTAKKAPSRKTTRKTTKTAPAKKTSGRTTGK